MWWIFEKRAAFDARWCAGMRALELQRVRYGKLGILILALYASLMAM